MVHDVSHGVQIEAFFYSRLKGHEICQRALLGPPPQEYYNIITRPQICLGKTKPVLPRMHLPMFLIAVHCDITVWYMTSVMGYKSKHLSIHALKAARSVSARSWARPSGALILLRTHRSVLE